MSRFWKAPLIAALALGTLFISAPPASAALRGGFHAYYGHGWYGGGLGLGSELVGPINGHMLFQERVEVIPGHTTEIHTNPAG